MDVERVAENYRQFGSLPRDSAVAAVAVFGGRVWVGTDGGLAWANLAESNLQDPQAWSTAERVGNVTSLLVASDTLFAAADRSILRWDTTLKRWLTEVRLGTVTSLGMYDGSVVALGKEDIFHRLSRGNWTTRWLGALDRDLRGPCRSRRRSAAAAGGHSCESLLSDDAVG